MNRDRLAKLNGEELLRLALLPVWNPTTGAVEVTAVKKMCCTAKPDLGLQWWQHRFHPFSWGRALCSNPLYPLAL